MFFSPTYQRNIWFLSWKQIPLKTFGITIALSSLNPKKQKILYNAIVILFKKKKTLENEIYLKCIHGNNVKADEEHAYDFMTDKCCVRLTNFSQATI